MTIFQKVFLLISCLVGAQLISLFACPQAASGQKYSGSQHRMMTTPGASVSPSRCYSHYTNYSGYWSAGLTHSHCHCWRGEGCWLGKVVHWATLFSHVRILSVSSNSVRYKIEIALNLQTSLNILFFLLCFF